MRLDYDARLRLRRFSGVLGPLVLLPAAVWFYVETPPSEVARPAPAQSSPSAGSSPSDDASPSARTSPSDASPSVVVQVDVLPDGSFDVVETVRLPEAVDDLQLVPRPLARAGAPFEDADPVHSDVEVRVPGEPPVRVAEVGTGARALLPAPTDAMEVSYRLDGATVLTLPGPPGRALGAVAPLTDAVGLQAGFEVAGAPVRAVTCPTLPPDQQLCGSDEAGAVVVDPRPASTALVVVQLDLEA